MSNNDISEKGPGKEWHAFSKGDMMSRSNSSVAPLRRNEVEMFASCKSCRGRRQIVCKHTKESSFAACALFKRRIKTMVPCQQPHDISFIARIAIPDNLSNTFVGFDASPDGNCFYNAVSICLAKKEDYAKCLRQAAALEYLMNSELRQFITRQNISSQEVLAKALEGEWADSTSIFLMSSVIAKRIEVIHLTCIGSWSSCYYDANPNESQESIYLFLHANHFSPLIPISKDIQLPAASFSPFAKNQQLQSSVSSDKSVEVIDLCSSQESLCNSEDQNNTSYSDHGDHVTHMHPIQSDLSVKGKILDKIRQDLECANTNEQYIDVCRKHNLIQAERTLLGRMRQRSETKSSVQFSVQAKVPDSIPTVSKMHEQVKCNSADPHVASKALTEEIVGVDGKFSVDIDKKFERCLNGIMKEIHHLKHNGKQANILSFVLQYAKSRTHWIEKPPPGVKYTKYQQSQRDKHSKVLFKLLEKPAYQKRFVQMLAECGESGLAKPFLNELTKLKENTVPAKDHKSFGESESESQTPPQTENAPSEDSNVIGMEAMAHILNVAESELNYQPPLRFNIEISSANVTELFDFSAGLFKKRKWAGEISKAITAAQGTCSFKATHQPTYHVKENSNFATLNGKCGCGLEFIAEVSEKPQEDEDLNITVSTKGAFSLLQENFTGRQISGTERKELAKKLQHVKAEAVFLENVAHLPALRLLHGNYSQASRHVLRKIKSQKKLEDRLHPDPVKDMQEQTVLYKTANPSLIVPGYIQYYNPTPGNFKVILYDQGSLSLHADQASKSGTVCFLDATGGVISKMDGKEILFYQLLGKRVSDCTYIIGEMLSERGTIVELTDFLRRIKHDVLKVRPSFTKRMAEMIVVDWSWPLIHSAANAWNTETIQDYMNRSFSLLEGSTVDWNKKCCIFICTSHLVNAFYRNLCKRLSVKQQKCVMNYALASIARLQETFSLDELRAVTRDVTTLFGKEKLSCTTIDNLCMRLKEHKNAFDLVRKEDEEIFMVTDNSIAIELASSKNNKLLREHSPFYHVFKLERKKQMQIKDEDEAITNPFYCPLILDVLERDKVAMYPFWSAAVPRKVLGNKDFIRETNSTVESSFFQMKKLQTQNGRVPYPDFVRFRHTMQTGKNKDSLSKLVKHKVRESAKQKPTQLVTESWRKKDRKKVSHFSPKVSRKPQPNFSEGKPNNFEGEQDNFAKNSAALPCPNAPGSVQLKILYPRRGIPNIGNTCYMNATVQLLIAIPEIRTWTADSSMVRDLFNFIFNRVQRDEDVSTEDAEKIFDYVNLILKESGVKELYERGLQYDATEYFRHLIDLPGMEKVKDEIAISLINYYSCSSCGLVEEIMDVTDRIDIDVSNGFTAGINAFLTKPELSECYKCRNMALSNNITFASKPNILVIATNLLEGIRDSRGTYMLKKNRSNDYITFSLNVDEVSYELHGVLCHIGNMATSGHYVAYLNKGGNLMLCCDDENVTNSAHVRGDVYMYLFRKVTTNLSESL